MTRPSTPTRLCLSTGAVSSTRRLQIQAKVFDEKSFWLLGPRGLDGFDRLPRGVRPEEGIPEGGYFVLSDGEETEREVKCVFDCGRLGYTELAAHGHATP